MPVHQFALPDVGEGLTEAEVVHWRVAVGDTVAVNDPVVEVETAKSIVELPSPYAGVVAGLLVAEGFTVDVGTPLIAVTVASDGSDGDDGDEDDDDGDVVVAAVEATDPAPLAPDGLGGSGEQGGAPAGAERTSVLVGYGPRASVPLLRRRRTTPGRPAVASGEHAGAANGAAAGTPNGAAHPSVAERVLARATPPVRALARSLGVDLHAVAGTGAGGTITREDLHAHHSGSDDEGDRGDGAASAGSVQTTPSTAAPAGQPAGRGRRGREPRPSEDGRETRVPVRGVRKVTAEQMVASAFTAPHATAFVTVDVTRTVKLLERLRAEREFRDVHVSPLLVTARAVCLAVARHPGINASWDEAAREIVLKHYVNLGIAVATPRGLLVPSVKDAERMSLRDLALALSGLVRTARDGRSTPADLAGSTISITNIGVFGVDSGTPILNPGEAAILCLGAVRERPWVHKGKIRARWVAELSVSFDHRLVDGDLGSRFLADVAAVLERPDTALRWSS